MEIAGFCSAAIVDFKRSFKFIRRVREVGMAALKKCFYKFLFRWFIRNKHKRKQLYICLPKTGIVEYRRLSRLSSEENRENRAFKYFMSIACIIKNEGPYLREWLEYHKLIGVEHFYVYDNESSDNTKEVLQPYIDAGDVTYIYFPGRDRQDPAYCHAAAHFGQETRWMAVVDLDEFIVLHEKDNLRDFMAEYADCSQISLHWVIYGSSGHEKRPDGLVLENFRGHSAVPDFSPKSIFNPRTVVDCGAHYMWVCGKWVNENGAEFGKDKSVPVKKAQINHYVIKSWEEFYNRKAARGCVNLTQSFGDDLRRYFDQWDCNDIYDDLMQPYVEKLKKRGVK